MSKTVDGFNSCTLWDQLFAIWTSGYIEIYFQYVKDKPPFDNQSKRKELLKRLNAISGISLPESKIDKRPSFSIDALKQNDNLDEFLKICDWMIGEIELSQI